MSEPVGAIFFDAVGTLIHPEPHVVTVYAEVGKRHGTSLCTDEIRDRFFTAFKKQSRLDEMRGWKTSEEMELFRWRQIVKQVFSDVRDTEACFRELWDHFSQPEHWRITEGADEVLCELLRRGWVLGLASNFDARLRGIADATPDLWPLTRTVISSEVGWLKPAAEFFECVKRCVEVPPEKILFVGDDRRNDYEGAEKAGLTPVLYDPTDCEPGFRGFRIPDLRELLLSC